jgi:hypothetical protein
MKPKAKPKTSRGRYKLGSNDLSTCNASIRTQGEGYEQSIRLMVERTPLDDEEITAKLYPSLGRFTDGRKEFTAKVARIRAEVWAEREVDEG